METPGGFHLLKALLEKGNFNISDDTYRILVAISD
jgi:hypothetical protein